MKRCGCNIHLSIVVRKMIFLLMYTERELSSSNINANNYHLAKQHLLKVSSYNHYPVVKIVSCS